MIDHVNINVTAEIALTCGFAVGNTRPLWHPFF